MSLRLEKYVEKDWVRVGELLPGMRPGSMSDNKLDGSRDIYMFRCEEDNSKSVIYRSVGGYLEIQTVSALHSKGLVIVRELTLLRPSYEMEIRTSQKNAVKIRFTHV